MRGLAQFTSQDSSRDSYLTDPHNEQLPNVRFSLHTTLYVSSSSDKPPDESTDIPAAETVTSDSTSGGNSLNNGNQLLAEVRHKVTELKHEIKQKGKQ